MAFSGTREISVFRGDILFGPVKKQGLLYSCRHLGNVHYNYQKVCVIYYIDLGAFFMYLNVLIIRYFRLVIFNKGYKKFHCLSIY